MTTHREKQATFGGETPDHSSPDGSLTFVPETVEQQPEPDGGLVDHGQTDPNADSTPDVTGQPGAVEDTEPMITYIGADGNSVRTTVSAYLAEAH
jgi:hypothetical protein